MEELKTLSEGLTNPGVDGLYRASQRQKLGFTKKQVAEFVATKAEKQVFQKGVVPSQGRIASESIDARWQIDILIFYEAQSKDKAEKKPV